MQYEALILCDSEETGHVEGKQMTSLPIKLIILVQLFSFPFHFEMCSGLEDKLYILSMTKTQK